jgi:hypothetical protein
MRTCSKCQQVKSLNEFYKHKKGKDGFSYDCKFCIKQQSKDHHKKYQQTCKGKENHKKSCFQWNYKKQGIYEWYENNTSLYIGKSVVLNSRISYHKANIKKVNLNHPHFELYEALRQHQNPQIRIIEECSAEKLLERENYYIDIKKPLYNKFKLN